MQDTLSSSSERVQAALDAYGLDFMVLELPSSTRTASEAAASIGCEVSSIVKSLLFTGKHSGRPVLVLVSGINRVDEELLSDAAGEDMVLADPKKVREMTGYAIGGVPPVGFPEPIPSFIDQALTTRAEVWAAAGTPFSVFRLTPDELIRITRGEVVQIS